MSTDENESDEERRLREVEEALDEFPPELVAEEIRRRGLIDKALDALVDIALNGENPDDRKAARRSLEERGLGLAIWAREEDGSGE